MSGSRTAPRAGIDELTPEEMRAFQDGAAEDALESEVPQPRQRRPAQRRRAAAPEPPADPLEVQEGDLTPEAPDGTETSPDGQQRQTEPQHVPLATHLEERKARQAAEANVIKITERLNLLTQALQTRQPDQTPQPRQPDTAPPVDPDPMPDISTNPAEFVKWQGRRIERLEAAETQRQQQLEIQTRVNKTMTQAAALERKFIATTPDYNDAIRFLQTARVGQLEEMGYDEDVIARTLAADALGMATRALEQGKNPAEVAYAIAKRNGYVAAAPVPNGGGRGAEPPPIEDMGAAPGGGTRQPVVPQTPADPGARVTSIMRGQGMGGMPGGSAPLPRLTGQAIADMTDAQFARVLERASGNPQAMEEIFGA